MKKVELTQSTTASDLIGQNGQEEEVLVMRDGHPVALIVPFDDDDLEWYAQEHDPEFLESLEQGRKDIAEGRGITHEELKKQLGIE